MWAFDKAYWVICILFALAGLVQSALANVDSPDLARRFGIAESSLASSKRSWKVECSEHSSDFFDRYRDVDEVENFIKTTLKGKLHGSVSTIGETANGREILALDVGEPGAPIVLALAGVHGREWTSIAALLFAMNSLTSKDLEGVRVIFVPLVNPDGYAKTFDGGTHTKERFKQGVGVETDADQPNRYWRKNGAGIDLNRNFGANWHNDTTKSSKMKNSDVYHGPRPFSELETQALQSLAEKHIDELAALVDFHCCIGAVLGPPSLSKYGAHVRAENERIAQKLVNGLSAGGKGVTKTVSHGDGAPGAYVFRPRAAKDLAAGTTSAWGFQQLALDLTYIVEMRGKFVAPCFEIKQLGKEALFGLRALFPEVAARPTRSFSERMQARMITTTSSATTAGVGGWTKLLLLGCFAVLAYLLVVRRAVIVSVVRKSMGAAGKDVS